MKHNIKEVGIYLTWWNVLYIYQSLVFVGLEE